MTALAKTSHAYIRNKICFIAQAYILKGYLCTMSLLAIVNWSTFLNCILITLSYTIVHIVHHLAERLGPEIDMCTFWLLLVALPTYIINE